MKTNNCTNERKCKHAKKLECNQFTAQHGNANTRFNRAKYNYVENGRRRTEKKSNNKPKPTKQKKKQKRVHYKRQPPNHRNAILYFCPEKR